MFQILKKCVHEFRVIPLRLYRYTISIQFQKIDNIFSVTKSAVPVSIWRLSFLSKVSLIAIQGCIVRIKSEGASCI